MLQNAYLLAKIGADTAESEQHVAEILPIGRRVARDGRRLLVHCDEGANRAAAVAVAYLMDPGKGPLLFY